MSTLARITLGRLVPPGSGGSGPPAGVVGGFIETLVQEIPTALARVSPITAGAQDGSIRATVVSTFTASVAANPITAVVLPSPITAELK